MEIQEIAARRGVYMFEHGDLVLCVADNHWFSTAADVRYADREDTDDTEGMGPNEVFFMECTSVDTKRMGYDGAVRIEALLDALREKDPATYAQLGGDHDAIVREAM